MMSYRIVWRREKGRRREREEESEAIGLWGKGTQCHMGFSVRDLYQIRHEEWPELSCSNMAATCSPLRAVCKELIPSFGVIATKIPELAASHSFLLPWQSLIWSRPSDGCSRSSAVGGAGIQVGCLLRRDVFFDASASHSSHRRYIQQVKPTYEDRTE